MTLWVRVFAACLLGVAATAWGQSRQYISDELLVLLRTGPSTQNAILRNLPAGTALEVLERNAEGDYARVRLSDGAEGWLLSQYLTPEPIARDRLAAAESNVAAARERIAELEGQVAELTEGLQSADAELGAAKSENASMSENLEEIRAASANVIAMRDQNTELRARVAELSDRLDQATMTNAALSSRSRQSWFVVGAGVLLGGIVIGLIAPSLRRKRRTSW
jgi:SH3 domain protein